MKVKVWKDDSLRCCSQMCDEVCPRYFICPEREVFFVNDIVKELWERSKSPVVQTAVISLVFLVFKSFGLFSKVGLTPESYNELTAALIAVINAFAAYHNPKNKEGF